MSKSAIIDIGVGAAAIVAGVFIPGLAVLAPEIISAGASMAVGGIVAGIASLEAPTGGISTATRNPISPHNYQFGYCSVSGTTVFLTSNSNAGNGATTSDNKQLHLVRVLNAHPSAIGTYGTGTSSDWELYVGGKPCQMEAHDGGYLSVSPTQQQITITSISRSGGLVTIKLASGLSGANGTTCYVKNVADNTYNCICILTQPNPSDDTTFTYVCGGADGSSSGGVLGTAYEDVGSRVYVEFLNGNHTSTFSTLLTAGTQWGSTDLWLGRTVMYIQLGYDSSDFGSIPDVRLVCRGNNMIYDPRTGTYGYSNNPALCIAYYLNLPRVDGGFGLQYGTDINTDQLIAAANICDETVTLAEGGTVARYTCNGSVQVSKGRGAILQDLLTSCAGRISFSGGQYYIFPGAWVAPTTSFSTLDFVGPIELDPILSSRDVANGAKGVFTSPSNNWAEADIPSYTQDTDHGYSTNEYLIQDNNEALYLTQNLPFTTDVATAQRILKIYMMRTRFQQRVTVRLSMKAFSCIPLDVITITHPKYGWNNTYFEVLSANICIDHSNDNPRMYMQLELALTDPSIYDWNVGEELSATGYIQPDNRGGTATVTEPNDLVLYSGPGTTMSGVTYPSTISYTSDGIARNSLYVSWVAPNDVFVTSGGHIQVQYQLSGSSAWNDAGTTTGSATSFTIPNVTDGQAYNVQIRAVNVVGNYSEWLQAGPLTISEVVSDFATSSGFNSLGWTATGMITINYTTTNSSATFTWAAQTVPFSDGTTLSIPAGSLAYTGLSSSTTYYTYWYANASTGVLGVTNPSPPGTSPDTTLAALTASQGRISFPVISFTTLAAANTGTGGGTGGGANTCPEADETVETENRGTVRAGDVVIGDMLKGYSFETKADVYRKVIAVKQVSAATWRMVQGHRISPGEPVYVDDKWLPAYKAPNATLDTKVGTRVRISIESDKYDEQNYYLVNGEQLLIHNVSLVNPC